MKNQIHYRIATSVQSVQYYARIAFLRLNRSSFATGQQRRRWPWERETTRSLRRQSAIQLSASGLLHFLQLNLNSVAAVSIRCPLSTTWQNRTLRMWRCLCSFKTMIQLILALSTVIQWQLFLCSLAFSSYSNLYFILNMCQNNTWTYIKTDETDCVGNACENKEHPNGTIIVRRAMLHKPLFQTHRTSYESGSRICSKPLGEKRWRDSIPYKIFKGLPCQLYMDAWGKFFVIPSFESYFYNLNLRRILEATFLMLKRSTSNANWRLHLLTKQPLRSRIRCKSASTPDTTEVLFKQFISFKSGLEPDSSGWRAKPKHPMDFNSLKVWSDDVSKCGKVRNPFNFWCFSNGDVCSFPFRFNGILYYACTNITINGTQAGQLGSPQNPVHICATEHNEDFNPIKMGFCDTSFRSILI